MGVRAKIHDGLLNRGAATLTFPEIAPYGLGLNTPHKVDAIPVDGLNHYIHSKWRMPKGMPYTQFSRRVGVNVPILKKVEAGTSQLSFEAAAALFREFGGRALMLAFSEGEDDSEPVPIRLIDADSRELIKPLFIETYKAKELPRAEVARRLGQSTDTVIAFEGTRNSQLQTIVRYFGTGLGVHVELLGLQPPPPTQPPI